MCSIKLLLPSLHFYPTIHPLAFPHVPPLLLPAFVLKDVKFLLCRNFWKNQVLSLFPSILKLVLFSLKTPKDAAKATISVHAAQLETTPFRQPPIPCSPIASPCWTPGPFESTAKPNNNREVLSTYNKAMDEIATEISCERASLNSQLDSWEKSNLTERQYFIQKATEDCMLVCDVIAPKDGKHLFQALTTACKENLNDEEKVDDVTKSLMSAYRNAKTRNTKTQILSLYAYKYSVRTLKELHYPYEKLWTHQINQTRCQARTLGPGTVPEKKNTIVCVLT